MLVTGCSRDIDSTARESVTALTETSEPRYLEVLECRTIDLDISGHITEDEFTLIADFILTYGQMGLYGSLHGALPFYRFESLGIDAWLIPEWDFFVQGFLRIEEPQHDPPGDYGGNLLIWPIPDSAKNSDNFYSIDINSWDCDFWIRYDIRREVDSHGNRTGNLVLVDPLDLGIEEVTDEQILAQLMHILNEVRDVR